VTLDDLEGQYCNRNCIGCSASNLATAGLLVSNRPQNTIPFCKKTAYATTYCCTI